MGKELKKDSAKGVDCMKNYSEDAERQYHIQVSKGEVGRYVICLLYTSTQLYSGADSEAGSYLCSSKCTKAGRAEDL